ncbi:MAG: hypothetical protein KBA26_14610, partial [Candidatus Delongbacteria bacterium]|nr:hypothetical protein [Candidatus Delongbacteria bacterium]
IDIADKAQAIDIIRLPFCGRNPPETWKLGNLETWKLGNLETWKLGNLETCGMCESTGDFQKPFSSTNHPFLNPLFEYDQFGMIINNYTSLICQ